MNMKIRGIECLLKVNLKVASFSLFTLFSKFFIAACHCTRSRGTNVPWIARISWLCCLSGKMHQGEGKHLFYVLTLSIFIRYLLKFCVISRNWRSYGNDEYENIDDDGSSIIGLDEEDPRGKGNLQYYYFFAKYTWKNEKVKKICKCTREKT